MFLRNYHDCKAVALKEYYNYSLISTCTETTWYFWETRKRYAVFEQETSSDLAGTCSTLFSGVFFFGGSSDLAGTGFFFRSLFDRQRSPPKNIASTSTTIRKILVCKKIIQVTYKSMSNQNLIPARTKNWHNSTTGKKVPPAHAKQVYFFLRLSFCPSVRAKRGIFLEEPQVTQPNQD